MLNVLGNNFSVMLGQSHRFLGITSTFWGVSTTKMKLEAFNIGRILVCYVLRTSRMRWFGHVERSTGWIAEVRKLNVVAQKRSGRPRKSWDEVIENDRKKLDMDSADPQNRSEWRGRL